MNRRAARVCGVVFALLVASSVAGAQTYPKLVTNGNGLAMTRLALDQHSGTSWVDAATYLPNVEYRLTVRLTNFYPPPNYGGMATTCHVNYLTDLRFEVGIPATFYANSSYSTVFSTGRYALQPDRSPLGSTESRTYFVYFKWTGPAIATSLVSHNVSVGGSEVCALPNMAMVPVRLTS